MIGYEKGDKKAHYIRFNFPTVHFVELPIKFRCAKCGAIIDFSSVNNRDEDGAYTIELYPHVCGDSS